MVEKLTITPELAHVVLQENQFVHAIMETGEDRFEAEFTIDGEHPYLYENPAIANHVSGTTFFEVSRQLMKATGHLFFSVPVKSRFLLKTIAIEFDRWGKIGVPVTAVIDVVSPGRGLNPFGTYEFTLSFYQDGWLLGTMKAVTSTMPAEVEDRLMSRQYRQPPVNCNNAA